VHHEHQLIIFGVLVGGFDRDTVFSELPDAGEKIFGMSSEAVQVPGEDNLDTLLRYIPNHVTMLRPIASSP
jgi:hypothetical protein